MEGWIKLHRKFTEWEWADEPNMVSLFIHLLLSASNSDRLWKGQKIKRGQLVFGRKEWSRKTGISEQSLRTCINRLKSTSELTTKVTSKFTLITICNYDEYQTTKNTNQPAHQPAHQPAINQQSTSNQPHREKERRKEGKKEVKEKKSDDSLEGIADWLLAG